MRWFCAPKYAVRCGGAQTRHGLARVENAATGAGDGIDEAPRRRCRSGEKLQEVERGTLAAEDRARRTCDREDDLLSRNTVAIGRVPGELHTRVELAESLSDPGAPAQHR